MSAGRLGDSQQPHSRHHSESAVQCRDGNKHRCDLFVYNFSQCFPYLFLHSFLRLFLKNTIEKLETQVQEASNYAHQGEQVSVTTEVSHERSMWRCAAACPVQNIDFLVPPQCGKSLQHTALGTGSPNLDLHSPSQHVFQCLSNVTYLVSLFLPMLRMLSELLWRKINSWRVTMKTWGRGLWRPGRKWCQHWARGTRHISLFSATPRYSSQPLSYLSPSPLAMDYLVTLFFNIVLVPLFF